MPKQTRAKKAKQAQGVAPMTEDETVKWQVPESKEEKSTNPHEPKPFKIKKNIRKAVVSRKAKEKKEKAIEKALALEDKSQVKQIKKKKRTEFKERWKALY
eukprot:TRINITY_DN8844_c0_g1_i1.p1 TRINITY_DN8844_c0_g1~~TRINITY_DN8844_c0_g1_i1.p1  ORF type:complete len:101 (-),score=37.68 TRINITY_DN8844_c0_g1_i1:68-370(-)